MRWQQLCGHEPCLTLSSRRDLASVPADLRQCLESALGLDPSKENLEIYLPDIRNIIVTLLHGLKNKQAIYRRTMQNRPGGGSADRPAAAASTPRPAGSESPASQTPGSTRHRSHETTEAGPSTGQRYRARGGEHTTSSYHDPSTMRSGLPQAPATEPRSDRRPGGPSRGLPTRPGQGLPLPPAPPDAFRPPRARVDGRGTPSPTPPTTANTAPTRSSSAQSNLRPDITPDELVRHRLTDGPAVSPVDTTPKQAPRPTPPPRRHTPPANSRFSLDSEVDSPKRVNGLTRSSPAESNPGSGHRRTGSTQPSLPPLEELPPLQNAIELQGDTSPALPSTPLPQTQTPAALASLTALQNSEALNRRASKRYSQFQYKQMLPGQMRAPSSSLLRNAPGDSPQRPMRRVSRPVPPVPPIPASIGASGTADPADSFPPSAERASDKADSTLPPPLGSPPAIESGLGAPDLSIVQEDTETAAPTDSSETRVFLQYGRETKRSVLDFKEISSVADLKGVFMSKFEYAPDAMELFPDVYIKDPASGIAYHLEEIDDIKDGSLLSLNIDRESLRADCAKPVTEALFPALDQVRQHFDSTITGLMHEIRDLKNNVISTCRLSAVALAHPTSNTHLSPIMLPADSQPMRLVVSPQTTPKTPSVSLPPTTGLSTGSSTLSGPDLRNQFSEIQDLRRELGIMRQVYVDFVAQTKTTFESMRDQTQAVRELATTKLKGSRSLVDTGKTSLERNSQDALQSVENVSEVIDAVKEDVLKRQILPRPGQIEGMKKDLQQAKDQVTALREQLTLAAPTWKQTWNQELKNVLTEQQLLQHHEKFTADLEGDITEASEIFATLQEYVAQRQAGVGKVALRSYQPPPEAEKDAVPNMLLEIRTKGIDPNRRLKAIEEQQKARQKELAEKGDEFSNELSGFVGARKLKKAGGHEEADRLRARKQEQHLKRMYSGKGKDEGGVSDKASERAGSVSSAGSPLPSPKPNLVDGQDSPAVQPGTSDNKQEG